MKARAATGIRIQHTSNTRRFNCTFNHESLSSKVCIKHFKVISQYILRKGGQFSTPSKLKEGSLLGGHLSRRALFMVWRKTHEVQQYFYKSKFLFHSTEAEECAMHCLAVNLVADSMF